MVTAASQGGGPCRRHLSSQQLLPHGVSLGGGEETPNWQCTCHMHAVLAAALVCTGKWASHWQQQGPWTPHPPWSSGVSVCVGCLVQKGGRGIY